MITAFAGLAAVNASVMALVERRGDLDLVRLIGATDRQTRRQIACEAAVITFVGIAVGVLVSAIAVSRIAERPGWHLVVPTTTMLAILTGAALLGVASTIVPARILLNRPAIRELR